MSDRDDMDTLALQKARGFGVLRRRLVPLALSALGLAVLVSLSWLWWPKTTDSGVGRNAPENGEAFPVSAPGQAIAPPDDAAPDEPLWVGVDEASVTNPPPYASEWSEAGRALVRVSDTRRYWRVGDRLTLHLPQLGETYRPVVEAIDEAVGSQALLGWIAGDGGRRNRYVVTVGPSSLFAFIDTPNGSYEMMADLAETRYAWLLPSASMMARWDFSKPDYILPDDDGRSDP